MEKQLYIKFLHDCLLIKDILVIGDIHIGYDEMSDGRAIFPKLQLEEILGKLKNVFDFLEKQKIKIKKIVLLGDVKHDFGEITDIEWRETLKFFDFLREKVNKIVIVKGNHDVILKPVVKKRDISLKDYYCIRINTKKICFLHGNKLFKQCLDSDILVFGHLHPAITLSDKYKTEKYKCFLKGGWKINSKNKKNWGWKINSKNKNGNIKNKKEVYILPSFSHVSFGYDLRNIDVNNRYQRKKNKEGKEFFVVQNKDLKNFEVVIYNNKENKEYNFGILRNLI